jgi:signal transduction histidine kinase
VEYDVLEERVQHRTKELHSANCSLREREHRLETLSRELLNAQETERRNLARELHDEIGQLLTVIKMHLRSAQRKSDDVVTKDLDQAVQTIDDTINQVRSLSLRLRPSVLDDLGLIPALEWQADQVLEKTGIQVRLRADLEPLRLRSELETVFFRVAQEALTNVMRHSQATSVSILLSCLDSRMTMTIIDDGIGFDLTQVGSRTTGGLGLSGMRERVELVSGILTLKSEPGCGTQLSLECDNCETPEPQAVQS